MIRSSKFFWGAAALAAALSSNVQAQSVTLTAAIPKGSIAETTSKDKTLPSNTKFTPCRAAVAEKDQFAFSIKYDIGTVTPAPNVYLIFKAPDGTLYSFHRSSLSLTAPTGMTTISATGTLSDPAAAGGGTDLAYTLAANNLGGAQTEVILGGNISLEGLPTGLWSVTAIIAPSGTSYKNTSAWLAWDSLPFMVGGPWLRSAGAGATCT